MHYYPHIKEFSKNSKYYKDYSFIQKEVASTLVNGIKNSPKKIIDLGCGSGFVYNNISWRVEEFLGLDLSQKMLNNHKKDTNITLSCENFDEFDTKKFSDYDAVISSSSLQWSKDIDRLLLSIEKNAKSFYLAIFCDKTFESLNTMLNKKTFLPNSKELQALFNDKDIIFEVKEYKKEFEDNLSLFRYIKKSGVSGGERSLSYKEIKEAIKNYDKSYLEFEVLYIRRS